MNNRGSVHARVLGLTPKNRFALDPLSRKKVEEVEEEKWGKASLEEEIPIVDSLGGGGGGGGKNCWQTTSATAIPGGEMSADRWESIAISFFRCPDNR